MTKRTSNYSRKILVVELVAQDILRVSVVVGTPSLETRVPRPNEKLWLSLQMMTSTKVTSLGQGKSKTFRIFGMTRGVKTTTTIWIWMTLLTTKKRKRKVLVQWQRRNGKKEGVNGEDWRKKGVAKP